MTPIVTQTLQAIAAHPRGNDIARLVRDCLLASAPHMPASSAVQEHAATAALTPDDVTLESVRVLEALATPPSTPETSLLLGALLAYAIALDPAKETSEATAFKLTTLATHVGVDAFVALDAAMGDGASPLWGALADLVRKHDKDGSGLSRPEAIVAACALATSESATARTLRGDVASACKTPTLARLLHAGGAAPDGSDKMLAGEIAPAPRGPLATFFLGLVGWLLVSHVARLVGRFALQYRRPAEVRVTRQGIQVRSTTQMLGKVLRESETLIPLDGLVRATREVRFPRLGTYAGLVTLAIGSYVGVSWFIDGIRSGSFSLATVGLLIILGGVALDFALVSLLPGRKGRCRVVFVPRKGAVTCVGWVDAAKADVLLRGIAKAS
jgi:hypothetical protein